MKKTILFDLDGTLTDSGEGIINCAKLALHTFGIPIPDDKTMRTIVGPPLDDSLIRLGVPADRVWDAVDIFRERYTAVGKYENVPYPGIHHTLAALQEQGHTLCVATSKPEVMALDILDHFELSQYFTKICGASLDNSRSSKSAVIAYLIEQNGRADNMVMVGDTAFDVLGAAAHGIPTIGVCWGYGEPEDLKAAGAVSLVHNMDELLMCLNQDCPLPV